jgi:hypothetical protein
VVGRSMRRATGELPERPGAISGPIRTADTGQHGTSTAAVIRRCTPGSPQFWFVLKFCIDLFNWFCELGNPHVTFEVETGSKGRPTWAVLSWSADGRQVVSDCDQRKSALTCADSGRGRLGRQFTKESGEEGKLSGISDLSLAATPCQTRGAQGAERAQTIWDHWT